MVHWPRISKLLASLATAILVCTTAIGAENAPEDPRDPDVRIRFYEAKLAEHENLFAGHAALGAAYLDKARASHDVRFVAKAREALERSLEIQPNLNALVSMAALCSFSHRFQCALDYAEQAASARADDLRIRSIRIEAQLGLGRTDDVRALLEASKDDPKDVLLEAGRGRWLAELRRFDEAHDAFERAAARARESSASDLVLWCETQAAGTRLDSGDATGALPHLQAAAEISTSSTPLLSGLEIHWAEYHVLTGERERALRIYEALSAAAPDVEVARRGFVLAKQLGQEERAQRLFSAAERAAEQVLGADEVYALEPHARLYADALVKLDRAEELATRNLEWKHDRTSRDTLDYVRSRRAEGL